MQDLLHEPLLGWTLRCFLALMFGYAAVSKLGSIEEFYGVVRNFRLLPDALNRPAAVALPVVELAVAAGLLITPLAGPAAITAALLLAVFGLAIAINVVRGRTEIDCGCFRDGMKQRISWLLVGRNVVLTGLAVMAVALVQPVGGVMNLGTGLMAGAVMMLLYTCLSLLGGMTALQTQTQSRKGH